MINSMTDTKQNNLNDALSRILVTCFPIQRPILPRPKGTLTVFYTTHGIKGALQYNLGYGSFMTHTCTTNPNNSYMQSLNH